MINCLIWQSQCDLHRYNTIKTHMDSVRAIWGYTNHMPNGCSMIKMHILYGGMPPRKFQKMHIEIEFGGYFYGTPFVAKLCNSY